MNNNITIYEESKHNLSKIFNEKIVINI